MTLASVMQYTYGIHPMLLIHTSDDSSCHGKHIRHRAQTKVRRNRWTGQSTAFDRSITHKRRLSEIRDGSPQSPASNRQFGARSGSHLNGRADIHLYALGVFPASKTFACLR